MKHLRLTILGCATLLAASAGANTITVYTPSGAKDSAGEAVDASATFVTSLNTVTITLTDLLADPKSVGQLISDLSFGLSSGQTSGTLASSTGHHVTVNSNGSTTSGSTGSTGWGINAGTLHLNALGFVGPAGLIIGPPNSSGVYGNANSSIAGNGPHNPFLDGAVTFVVTVPGVNGDSRVNNVVFSFGTTPGDDVRVPDGGTTVLLLGAALSGLGLIRRKLS